MIEITKYYLDHDQKKKLSGLLKLKVVQSKMMVKVIKFYANNLITNAFVELIDWIYSNINYHIKAFFISNKEKKKTSNFCFNRLLPGQESKNDQKSFIFAYKFHLFKKYLT